MTTVTVSGSVTGPYKLQAPVTTLSITASGYIKSPEVGPGSQYGVYSPGTAASAYTVVNEGRIKSGGSGVYLHHGGAITNGAPSDTQAAIYGYTTAVALGASGSVTNYGTILSHGTTGIRGLGVYLRVGGVVINGGATDSSALIESGVGIELTPVGNYSAASLTNFGTVVGLSGWGVTGGTGASITNGSTTDPLARIVGAGGVSIFGSGSVDNLGTIIGLQTISDFGAYVGVRAGHVINGAPGEATALIEGVDVGVKADYLTNFGTIEATASGGYAAEIGYLTVVPESRFVGKVGAYVLDFASGTGTITTLSSAGVTRLGGTQYVGVRTLEFAGGSSFTLEGSVTLGTTQNLVVAGALDIAGTLDAKGNVRESGTISGGSLILQGGGTFSAGAVLALPDVGVDLGEVEVLTKLAYAGTWSQPNGYLEIGTGDQLTLSGVGDSMGGTIAGPGVLDIDDDLAVGSNLTISATLAGPGALSIEAGLTTFEFGTKLSVSRIDLTGSAARVNFSNGLSYAGIWIQNAGTASVIAGALNFTGTGNLFMGTLAGDGTVVFSAGSDALRSLTLSAAAARITGAKVQIFGVFDLPNVLNVSSPNLLIGPSGGANAEFTGGGVIQFSNLSSNMISGLSSTDVLENLNDTIEGAGQIDGLKLRNEAAGRIIGNDSNALTIDTGANTIVNAGLIRAAGAGGVVIASAVSNTGTLAAAGGTLTVNQAVTGTGIVIISAGVASFAASFSENVTFGASGVIELGDSQAYKGTISGFSKTGKTSVDLEDIAFGAGTKATFSGTTSSGTVTVTDGTHTARIKLAGNFTLSAWTIASDGHGGTTLTDPSSASGLVAAMAALGPTSTSMATGLTVLVAGSRPSLVTPNG